MSTLLHITIDDYNRMIEAGVFDKPDGRRVELIRGELRAMSLIGEDHALCVQRFTSWSYANLAGLKIAIRVQDPLDLPGFDSTPQPDIVWVPMQSRAGRRPSASEALLVVEVATTSINEDLSDKAELFSKAKVRDYWVVDVGNRRIIVHRKPTRAGYQSIRRYKAGEVVRPLAFPEISISAAEIFQ